MVTKERFAQGMTVQQYLDQMGTNKDTFMKFLGEIKVKPEDKKALESLGKKLKCMIITEDWCGDASNTVPYIAKLGAQAQCVEMRILRRDEHPEVMDRYLTGTSRAIPIVVVLDDRWQEIGHWGSRPAELQAWVMDARKTMTKEELYPQIRRWYAKDKGESTLREILSLLPTGSPALPQ